jgi:hypothetical protein
MSQGGRADAARLRRVIAEIEAKAGVSLASEGRAPQRAPFARAFDSALGGGLAEDGLHEIAPAAPADGPAAMAFALALAARFLDRRPGFENLSALMIGESFANFEAGALYGPGLVAHGLPLHRLVFVSAPDADAAFWATEEALKCGAPAAVVAEIWPPGLPPPFDGRETRRDAGAHRARQRLRPGGCAVHRRHDTLRNRRCAEREKPGGRGAGSPRPVRLHGATGQGATTRSDAGGAARVAVRGGML